MASACKPPMFHENVGETQYGGGGYSKESKDKVKALIVRNLTIQEFAEELRGKMGWTGTAVAYHASQDAADAAKARTEWKEGVIVEGRQGRDLWYSVWSGPGTGKDEWTCPPPVPPMVESDQEMGIEYVLPPASGGKQYASGTLMCAGPMNFRISDVAAGRDMDQFWVCKSTKGCVGKYHYGGTGAWDGSGAIFQVACIEGVIDDKKSVHIGKSYGEKDGAWKNATLMSAAARAGRRSDDVFVVCGQMGGCKGNGGLYNVGEEGGGATLTKNLFKNATCMDAVPLKSGNVVFIVCSKNGDTPGPFDGLLPGWKGVVDAASGKTYYAQLSAGGHENCFSDLAPSWVKPVCGAGLYMVPHTSMMDEGDQQVLKIGGDDYADVTAMCALYEKSEDGDALDMRGILFVKGKSKCCDGDGGLYLLPIDCEVLDDDVIGDTLKDTGGLMQHIMDVDDLGGAAFKIADGCEGVTDMISTKHGLILIKGAKFGSVGDGSAHLLTGGKDGIHMGHLKKTLKMHQIRAPCRILKNVQAICCNDRNAEWNNLGLFAVCGHAGCTEGVAGSGCDDVGQIIRFKMTNKTCPYWK